MSILEPITCPFCHKPGQVAICDRCGTYLPTQDPRPAPKDILLENRLTGEGAKARERREALEMMNFSPIDPVGDIVRGDPE